MSEDETIKFIITTSCGCRTWLSFKVHSQDVWMCVVDVPWECFSLHWTLNILIAVLSNTMFLNQPPVTKFTNDSLERSASPKKLHPKPYVRRITQTAITQTCIEFQSLIANRSAAISRWVIKCFPFFSEA